MDSVLADINIDDPSAIAGAEDAINAPGVTAGATEAKVRKEKKSKRKSDAMDIDEQAVPADHSSDDEKAKKKARKEEKKSKKDKDGKKEKRRHSEIAPAEEEPEKKKKKKDRKSM